MTARETSLVRAADRPIKRHVANVRACEIRLCAGCRDCRESRAFLDREIREGTARQNARHAIQALRGEVEW